MKGRFRPQYIHGPTKLQYALQGDFWGKYNWHRFVKYPYNRLNERTLGNIFRYLHHLSNHAPVSVNKKWESAMYRFSAHHHGNIFRGRSRFLNKYTAHRWL